MEDFLLNEKYDFGRPNYKFTQCSIVIKLHNFIDTGKLSKRFVNMLLKILVKLIENSVESVKSIKNKLESHQLQYFGKLYNYQQNRYKIKKKLQDQLILFG